MSNSLNIYIPLLDITIPWLEVPEQGYPQGATNITITGLSVWYLNCPERVTNLALYVNSPAAREEFDKVQNDG